MSETPTMLNVSVRLFGVKTTLKSVADRLELAMHGFSESDWMSRSARRHGEKTVRRSAASAHGLGSMAAAVDGEGRNRA